MKLAQLPREKRAFAESKRNDILRVVRKLFVNFGVGFGGALHSQFKIHFKAGISDILRHAKSVRGSDGLISLGGHAMPLDISKCPVIHQNIKGVINML